VFDLAEKTLRFPNYVSTKFKTNSTYVSSFVAIDINLDGVKKIMAGSLDANFLCLAAILGLKAIETVKEESIQVLHQSWSRFWS